MLDRFPDEDWVALNAADAYAACGDSARAETLCRAVLADAADDYAREGAIERLVPLQEESGRTEEAQAFRKELPESHADFGIDDEDVTGGDSEDLVDDLYPSGPTAPYVRPEPKVGRNEPCPCGSGRKYKKCCLR